LVGDCDALEAGRRLCKRPLILLCRFDDVEVERGQLDVLRVRRVVSGEV
jgi:hypothetical protein